MKHTPKQVLRALNSSVQKWRGVINGTITELGSENCPLCHLFNSDSDATSNACKECPIFAITRQRYCKGSPYIPFSNLDIDNDSYVISDEQLAAAQAELTFLRLLRDHYKLKNKL